MRSVPPSISADTHSINSRLDNVHRGIADLRPPTERIIGVGMAAWSPAFVMTPATRLFAGLEPNRAAKIDVKALLFEQSNTTRACIARAVSAVKSATSSKGMPKGNCFTPFTPMIDRAPDCQAPAVISAE